MKRNISSILLLLVVLLGTSCNGEYINQPLAEELKTSPLSVNIHGKEYYIYAYLQVDHSSPSEIFGLHTSCLLFFNTADTTSVDPGIEFIAKYVIKDDMVWQSPAGTIQDNPYFTTMQSHDGPNWGTDYFVDVVLEFSFQNQVYRLLAPRQYVHRVG